MAEEKRMNFSDNAERRQEISISDRTRLFISGVEDVQSFDDKNIILKSNFGMIAVDGEDLHIGQLSIETGELKIEGRIGGVLFFEPTEQRKKRGLLR